MFLDILKSIILGIVEGLTEFVPVSSTGHLIIVGDLLQFNGEFAKTFDIAIQMGAILAVVIVFKETFKEYVKFKPNLDIFPNLIHLFLMSLPALFMGYLLHRYIKLYLFSPFTVAIGLIVGAFFMIFADYVEKKQHNQNINVELTYGKSFLIGCFQCLALWPGMSRSGSTISGSLLLGLNYTKAASYSFICAVPVMLCATVYELLKSSMTFSSQNITLLLIGFVVSFIFGWLSIVYFLKLIAKIKLLPFAIYRIIIAIIILSTALGSKISS